MISAYSTFGIQANSGPKKSHKDSPAKPIIYDIYGEDIKDIITTNLVNTASMCLCAAWEFEKKGVYDAESHTTSLKELLKDFNVDYEGWLNGRTREDLYSK